MIMPSNNTCGIVNYFAGAYPGSIGLCISPKGWRRPNWYMPYALDNGAFTGFDENAFNVLLGKIRFIHPPIWVAVPDKVSDCEETNRLWYEWNKKIEYPKAFVVQDGHDPQDVPKSAYAVFVGGSTEWKIKSAHKFKGTSIWLHIGRVNTKSRLEWAEDIGADSVDGTGWFRSKGQKQTLIDFIMGTGQIKMF